MFIPRYWSQASAQAVLASGERFMVRRFGWSSASQADAAVHARSRLDEALQVLAEGGREALRTFTRIERKAAYMGADGLPIREEIIAEFPEEDTVITRNSYGALCLNTQSAMFVDIDAPQSRAYGQGCLTGCLIFPLLMIAGVWPADLPWTSALLGAVTCSALLGWFRAALVRRQEVMDPRFRDLIEWTVDKAREWCGMYSEWRVRIYETPAGARVVATHDTFEAGEEPATTFMAFMKADPLYEHMCRLQRCFRARVTPKPWRTRLAQRFRSGGTWPVSDPEALERRATWAAAYEQIQPEYASCRYVKTIGPGPDHPRIARIVQLHDDYCNANRRLPLA